MFRGILTFSHAKCPLPGHTCDTGKTGNPGDKVKQVISGDTGKPGNPGDNVIQVIHVIQVTQVIQVRESA